MPGLTLLLKAGVDPKQVQPKDGNSPLAHDSAKGPRALWRCSCRPGLTRRVAEHGFFLGTRLLDILSTGLKGR